MSYSAICYYVFIIMYLKIVSYAIPRNILLLLLPLAWIIPQVYRVEALLLSISHTHKYCRA
jgi:hypothetical protein